MKHSVSYFVCNWNSYHLLYVHWKRIRSSDNDELLR